MKTETSIKPGETLDVSILAPELEKPSCHLYQADSGHNVIAHLAKFYANSEELYSIQGDLLGDIHQFMISRHVDIIDDWTPDPSVKDPDNWHIAGKPLSLFTLAENPLECIIMSDWYYEHRADRLPRAVTIIIDVKEDTEDEDGPQEKWDVIVYTNSASVKNALTIPETLPDGFTLTFKGEYTNHLERGRDGSS